jgi:hypothetical protein
VEVWREELPKFEAMMKEQHVVKIGETVDDKRVVMSDGKKELVNLSLAEIRKAWSGEVC